MLIAWRWENNLRPPKSIRSTASILVSLLLGAGSAFARPGVYNVRALGAAGDGRTNDTAAIQKAIDAANSGGGGEVRLPAGTYLAGSIELKSRVTLNLAPGAILHGSADIADYPLVHARWEGIERQCHEALIFARDAEEIAITGSGGVIGEGKVGGLRDPRGPALIEPVSCKNVRISGVTLGNSRMWTLHPTYCSGVAVANVTIDSTGGNSDGIDPDSCSGVIIDHCTFSSGDDDIAIKCGKGQEGVKIGKPTEDVAITNCTFLKGHGGVALGSELSGGIRRVTIANCTFKGVNEAIYLKSRPGRAGYVQDVRANHLVVTGTPLLVIRTTYNSNADPQGVPGDAGLTSFSGIAISDVRANSESLVKIEATPEKPLDGLSLIGVKGTCAQGFLIRNARNVVLKDIQLTGIAGPRLYTENVQGTGLDGAAPASPVLAPASK